MSFMSWGAVASSQGGSSFAPFSTEYTTPGTQTVSIPAGATAVTIECIGAGGSGGAATGATYRAGGGGGEYAKTISYSLSGLTGLHISVPNSVAGVSASSDGNTGAQATVRENTSGGTIICQANGGQGGKQGTGSAKNGYGGTGGTGDVLHDGGTSRRSSNGRSGGGGAGGPTSAGGDVGNSSTGGAGGGSPAGAGGDADSGNGSNYGGGGGAAGGSAASGDGAQGWIKLSWA